jgi:hypothetical protein
VIAPRWALIAFVYYAYLFLVSLSFARFAAARSRTFVATACLAFGLGLQASRGLGADSLVVAIVPMVVLLVGYWLSGAFFVSPMPGAERWLMSVDERLLGRTGVFRAYATGPHLLREAFEMAYVLVYPVIPAAVTTLALGGRADAIPRFWSIVLLAEFVSYGMMPWLQTRPPRAIETAADARAAPSVIRRFNELILDRGSIQANTIPSGHAAGAVAAALAMVDVMPVAGVWFLLLAAAIVAATVLGRYHYLMDSVLGTAVAAAAWWLIR